MIKIMIKVKVKVDQKGHLDIKSCHVKSFENQILLQKASYGTTKYTTI